MSVTVKMKTYEYTASRQRLLRHVTVKMIVNQHGMVGPQPSNSGTIE